MSPDGTASPVAARRAWASNGPGRWRAARRCRQCHRHRRRRRRAAFASGVVLLDVSVAEPDGSERPRSGCRDDHGFTVSLSSSFRPRWAVVPSHRLLRREDSSYAGHDNEERFSLGGAAHEASPPDSMAGIRAGERKTGWTKPLPVPAGLWALNAARLLFPVCRRGVSAAVAGRFRALAGPRTIVHGLASGHLIFVPTHQRPVAAQCVLAPIWRVLRLRSGRNVDAGS